jgi:hypothetical protein
LNHPLETSSFQISKSPRGTKARLNFPL